MAYLHLANFDGKKFFTKNVHSEVYYYPEKCYSLKLFHDKRNMQKVPSSIPLSPAPLPLISNEADDKPGDEICKSQVDVPTIGIINR